MRWSLIGSPIVLQSKVRSQRLVQAESSTLLARLEALLKETGATSRAYKESIAPTRLALPRELIEESILPRRKIVWRGRGRIKVMPYPI
jgi:hypothetical protein